MHALISLLVVAAAPAPSPAAIARAAGDRAYNAKEYSRCAEQFTIAAKASSGSRVANLWYSAACCQALDGKTELALDTLDKAYAADVTDAAQIKADTDFASLSKHPRFIALVAKIEKRDAAIEHATQPALKKEINEMVAVDQAMRQEMIKNQNQPADPKVKEHFEAVDTKNTKRLKEIVAKYGWPGQTLVGRKASQGAWLLVQHADLDVPFQKQALVLLEAALKKKEVTASNVAYLADRIAVAEGRPQRYGTQFEGMGADMKPRPIEDEAHVDERRFAIGLESMADYTEQMFSMYLPPPPAPDAGAN